MCGAILPLPQYASMAWCSVKTKKHRVNFTSNTIDVTVHHTHASIS